MKVYNDHLSTKFRWFAQFFMSFSGFFSRHVNLESGDIQDAPWPFKPVIDAPEATWSFSKDSVSHWVKEVAMKKVELQEDFKWPKHSRRRCINIYDDFVFFCLPVFESRKGWPLHAIEISAAHPSIRLAIFTRWCSPCFTIFWGGFRQDIDLSEMYSVAELLEMSHAELRSGKPRTAGLQTTRISPRRMSRLSKNPWLVPWYDLII